MDITAITMDEAPDGVTLHFPGHHVGATEQWADDEGGHVTVTLVEVPVVGSTNPGSE